MPHRERGLVVRIDVPAEPQKAFDAFVDDLVAGLSHRGIRLAPGPEGLVARGEEVLGQITTWDRGKAFGLRWKATDWLKDAVVDVAVSFAPVPSGTRITLTLPGWNERISASVPDVVGWFAMQVAAPVVESSTPASLGDWLTDRRARRPSGDGARETYRDPVHHRPNFKLLLHALSLAPEDVLLEVGCGGGAFLADALQTGCRAAAIDHSADMVRLARDVNAEAVRAGRLLLVEADAQYLPYASGQFTSAVMTGVFFFIRDPIAALTELHRVLAPGGRLALFTESKELIGTPAAPEPMASRSRFYEDAELLEMATRVGFADARIERPDLGPYAREAGLPDDLVAMFSGSGGAQLLTARRP